MSLKTRFKKTFQSNFTPYINTHNTQQQELGLKHEVILITLFLQKKLDFQLQFEVGTFILY